MLPLAPFGRTGHQSSRVIFGAAALGAMSQSRADATLDVAFSRGVNHIDTAAGYGASEDLLRDFLADHRADVFLATKTGERSGAAARAQLEHSLVRMHVDSVDMIQLHNLVEDGEWETAMAPGGAVEALAAARDEGLVRFIGVTGHGLRIPEVHRRSLERFDFDAVLLPFNHNLMAIETYRASVDELLAICADRTVAVQTIKAIARRRWDDGPGGHRSWYEPITDHDAIGRAARYVLSRPQLFLNSSADATLLPVLLDAARGSLDAPSDAELERDERELGITPIFDGDLLERI